MKTALLTALALTVPASIPAFAGDLTPPAGPVDSTMKTLQQVEPRTPLADDPAGVAPVVIDQPGTYYLTGDIHALAGQDGIVISASSVRLDLRGFSVVGNRGLMTLSGISIADGVSDVSISDGSVRDNPENGVVGFNAAAVRLEKINVSNNSLHGIYLGDGAALVDCSAINNGNLATAPVVAGLRVGAGGSLAGCTSIGNYGYGIYSSGSAVMNCTSSQTRKYASDPVQISDGTGFGGSGAFENCTAVSNEDEGFSVAYSTVHNCSARSNLGGGFHAETTVVTESIATFNAFGFSSIYDATFERCRSRFNTGSGFSVNYGGTVRGCASSENGGHGIWVGYDSQIIDNNCRGNDGTFAGIYVPGDSNRIEGNTIFGNDIGLEVTGTDNLILGNSARGNSPNYNIVAGNEQGQIVTNPGMGFVNSNPWTNFAY